RAIARQLAPRLAPDPPARAAFVAPEAPVFAYHLFRTGLYWATPHTPWSDARRARIIGDPGLRAFIVDPSGNGYGGGPDSATLAWLERDTREITREIEALERRRISVRVFVRD
ncbi:MAG TPA: hypothetical protein VJY35_03440, partial [Candidatus Eisenbacteria bacterium]|nr:hypothetical protein [Candidatus Eisenbacteria bacterium]